MFFNNNSDDLNLLHITKEKEVERRRRDSNKEDSWGGIISVTLDSNEILKRLSRGAVGDMSVNDTRFDWNTEEGLWIVAPQAIWA